VDGAYEEIINSEGNPGCLAYARVSTADQDPRLQIDALTAHGCRRLFVEKISSRTKDRPGLAAALHRLDPGDTLVVWKLDRLGRSVTEVVGLAEQLHAMGVGLHILTGTLEGT
jgi:DNA invertase Pin-like site-specific DNA recombinase